MPAIQCSRAPGSSYRLHQAREPKARRARLGLRAPVPESRCRARSARRVPHSALAALLRGWAHPAQRWSRRAWRTLSPAALAGTAPAPANLAAQSQHGALGGLTWLACLRGLLPLRCPIGIGARRTTAGIPWRRSRTANSPSPRRCARPRAAGTWRRRRKRLRPARSASRIGRR